MISTELLSNQNETATTTTAVVQQCSWQSNVDLLSTFLSALVGLCRHFVHSTRTTTPTTSTTSTTSTVSPLQESFQQITLRLIGHFGCPELLSLSHGKFPSRCGDITQLAEYSEDRIRKLVVLRIYSMITCGLSKYSREAVSVLRNLSFIGYFKDISLNLAKDTLEDIYFSEITTEYMKSITTTTSSVGMVIDSSSSMNAFSETVWDTGNRDTGNAELTYTQWVTQLTYHLVNTLFTNSTTTSTNTTSSASGSRQKSTSKSKCKDILLTTLKPVLLLRTDIAEATFPLILSVLLREGGNSSSLRTQLSECITKYLLSPSCRFIEATQLGCRTIVHLFRQNIAQLVSTPMNSARSSAPTTSSGSSSWTLPFSCGLDIDLKLAATAATRVQLISTALLFAELSDETDRHAPDRDNATPGRSTIAPNRATVESTGLQTLLLPIYEGIHDADAIYGLDLSSSLELQALLFARKGRWMEALSTYEGIIQSQYTSSSTSTAQDGIAVALENLGARYTLNQYNSARQTTATSMNTTNYHTNASTTLQHWDSALQPPNSYGTEHTPLHNNFLTTMLPSSTTSSHPPVLNLTQPAQHWSNTIHTVLTSLNNQQYTYAIKQIQSNTSDIFNNILYCMQQETATNILPHFIQAQQLTEIYEIIELLEKRKNSTVTTSNTHSSGSSVSVDNSQFLLQRWKQRISVSSNNTTTSGSTSSSNNRNSSSTSNNINNFTLRSILLNNLIKNDIVRTIDVMNMLSESELTLNNNTSSVYAITPQIYQYWHYLTKQLVYDCSSNTTAIASTSISTTATTTATTTAIANLSNGLLTASMGFYECKLLWTKGLKDSAILNINKKVIIKLKQLLSSYPHNNNYSTTATATNTTTNTITNTEYITSQSKTLLSQALCLCGEWLSKKRSSTSTEILDDYLLPSIHYATTTIDVIHTKTTIAQFHSKLYYSLKEKIQSSEWQQGARVLSDRKKEYEECRVLQEKLKKESLRIHNTTTSTTTSGGAVDNNNMNEIVDLKSLYRHIITLKKEIEIDQNERQNIELSVQRHLIAAVQDYTTVLQLSNDANIEYIFRLIKLWLDNTYNVEINRLIEYVITVVPSYKFVPLSYQMLSRLGGSEDDSSGSGSGSVYDSGDIQRQLAEQLRDAYNTTGTTSATATSSSSGTKNSYTTSSTTTAGTTLKHKTVAFSRATTASSTDPIPNHHTTTTGSSFQLVLCKMVLKLCTDHPHHILPQLFALAHEREFLTKDNTNTHIKSNLSLNRFETSIMLINQLKSMPTAIDTNLITSMQTMLLAYIDLANTSTIALQKVNRIKNIKFKEIQSRGKRFDEIMQKLPCAPAVITLSLPLNCRNNYKHIVTIRNYNTTFSITDNGISRPKIIVCNGSDGKQYIELVKGGDDMRQDAVMQQVFSNVNYTLKQNIHTKQRNLMIRTYKIIPTTLQTGILEWVQSTKAFGSILCDREKGLHSRYYINDWSHMQCREYIKDAVDNHDKLAKYTDICANFHPVFRYFFIENFKDPIQWITARLNYTRSVACNSIIGYILGIGDRHAHNILIDTITAEVVHIDYGIVFDQGKGLGTPETVPFRLTRDIVDGMGVTACEGTFRCSCEEVLRVLREHTIQLMTILEVVIYDPLYKWSLSPLQARMKQNILPDFNQNLSTMNKIANKNITHTAVTTVGAVGATTHTKSSKFGKDAAERTLLRILNKLQGHEDASMGEALSIEGQIDLLINEARSPYNLSKLFPGWAPWL